MAKETTIKEKVIKLFKDKKQTHKSLVSWIEDNDLSEPEICDIVCDFATRYVAFLTGGRSQGIPPKDLIPEQEKMGIEVEYEHTPFQSDARKIAWDHLAEVKHYYTMLKHGEETLDEMGDVSRTPKPSLKKIKAGLLNRFVKLANKLDASGLKFDADKIDEIIKAANRINSSDEINSELKAMLKKVEEIEKAIAERRHNDVVSQIKALAWIRGQLVTTIDEYIAAVKEYVNKYKEIYNKKKRI